MKDRKNILFLAIGVLLSAVSKLLQFVYQSNIGDLVVLLAAVFFVLSILHSLTDFKALYHTAQGARQANLDGNPGLFGSGVISDYDDPDYWESQLDGVIAAGTFCGNGGTIWIQMVSKYCELERLTAGLKDVQNNDRYHFNWKTGINVLRHEVVFTRIFIKINPSF